VEAKKFTGWAEDRASNTSIKEAECDDLALAFGRLANISCQI
jgi:hypothetical protein